MMLIILEKLVTIFRIVGRFETRVKIENFFLKKEFGIKLELDLKLSIFQEIRSVGVCLYIFMHISTVSQLGATTGLLERSPVH